MGRLQFWRIQRRLIRDFRRQLADDIGLSIFVCGKCRNCTELKDYRAREGRRYW